MNTAQIIGFAFFIGILSGAPVGMYVGNLPWFRGEQ